MLTTRTLFRTCEGIRLTPARSLIRLVAHHTTQPSGRYSLPNFFSKITAARAFWVSSSDEPSSSMK